MQLQIQERLNREIIHYADAEKTVSSHYRTVYIEHEAGVRTIRLPEGALKRFCGLFRIARRALRLDKCNVYPIGDNLIIIRQGKVYFYDATSESLTETLTLRNCRNVLHQSISETPDGFIYFGEYGSNKKRQSVPVYRSIDGGRTWEEIYTFQPREIKHVHGCYYDKYSDSIWVCTGDFENENWLLVANKDFTRVEKIGDGQQQFRTCNLFFREHEVHWIMDSQLEPSYHIVLDRASGATTRKSKFPGPVWYIKELSDDIYLSATAQEIGQGVLDDKVHLCISKDLETWEDLKQFEHDGLPRRYFKFGVIGFADGPQSSQSFHMFFEAIRGLDGRSLRCQISH